MRASEQLSRRDIMKMAGAAGGLAALPVAHGVFAPGHHLGVRFDTNTLEEVEVEGHRRIMGVRGRRLKGDVSERGLRLVSAGRANRSPNVGISSPRSGLKPG